MQHIALIYGGQSAEHEVSLISARNILHAIDLNRYLVTLIRIDHSRQWIHSASSGESDVLKADLSASGEPVYLTSGGALGFRKDPKRSLKIDVAFPVLHGINGEDGTIQGLLQLYGIPFVGPGVLSSSVCMDKDVSKRLLSEAGILIPKFEVLHHGGRNVPSYDYISHQLGSPLFVKPANAGSSVGISKVKTINEYQEAVEIAFRYDRKVIVEQAIEGREIECAVLGRNPVRVSVSGEIKTTHSFYSYEAKYHDETATELIIPASLPDEVNHRIRDVTIQVCDVLGCHGMARVDFFLDTNDRLFVNEVNTIPGFTSGSMYPLLWQYSGVSFTELVDALLADALQTHRRQSQLTQRP